MSRVLMAEPVHGTPAQRNSVRLGNQLDLGPPTLGTANPISFNPEYRFLLKRRLVTVDSTNYPDELRGGAWALTLNADKVEEVAVPPPGSVVSTPLVANIQFGSGGISRFFQCDVWNTSLVIPADSVFVEVGWTEVSSFPPPGQTDLYPQSVTVAGTLSRVQSSDSNGALLTRRVNAASSGSLDPVTLKIPPFCTGWTVMNSLVPGPGSAQWASALVRGVGTNLDYVDNLYLDAQKESLAFRSLPSAAVSLVLTPAVQYAQAYVLFRIEF